ncbi:MAG: hypothetical protein IJ729_01580 [Alloprevotella sp.]|nr:hypothetical protein [Alloprevotella sp.]
MKKFFTLSALLLATVTASAQWSGYKVASISTEPASTLTDGYYALFQNGHQGFAFLAENPLSIGANGPTYNLAKSRISTSAPGISVFADLDADIATTPAPNDRLWYVFKIAVSDDGTCTIQCPDGTYFPEFGTRVKLMSSDTPGTITYHEHGSYFSFESNGQALDGDTYEAGYANVSTLATWDYSTPAADGNAAWTLYPVELEEVGPVNVTFNVVDATTGDLLETLTLPYDVGLEVTEVPSLLQRDFVTLTLQDVLVVSEDEEANQVNVTASWSLPFEVSTPDAPVYYFLNTQRGFFAVDLSRYSIPVGGQLNMETFMKDPYTLEQIRELPEADQLNYHFAFVGNPYEGFKVYSAAAQQYFIQRNDYTWVGDEDVAVAYELLEADGGFYLRNGEKLLGYLSGSLGQTIEENATPDGNVLTATPVEQGQQVEVAAVSYIVVGTDGDVLAMQEEEVEVGTEVTDIPDGLKRPYTDYTYPDEPLLVSEEGENTYTVTATFNEPFPVSTDDAPVAFFILLENADGVLDHALSQYPVPGAGTYVYSENALSINAAEGADLTDMNNWYTYRNEAMVLANPSTANQYGLNWSLHEEFYWVLFGNPYIGYQLFNGNSYLPFRTNARPYCELVAADGEASVLEVSEKGLFAGVPATDAASAVAKAPEGMRAFNLRSGDGYVKLHEYGVLEAGGDRSEALDMYFVPVDWELRAALYDAYLAAQEYINAVVGVKTPSVAGASSRTYDLQGRRLGAPKRGLNIVDGRKVFVK